MLAWLVKFYVSQDQMRKSRSRNVIRLYRKRNFHQMVKVCIKNYKKNHKKLRKLKIIICREKNEKLL
jgi:hypothetical protein